MENKDQLNLPYQDEPIQPEENHFADAASVEQPSNELNMPEQVAPSVAGQSEQPLPEPGEAPAELLPAVEAKGDDQSSNPDQTTQNSEILSDDDEFDDELHELGSAEYEQLSRAELVDTLQNLLNNSDFGEVRTQVAQIRAAFMAKTKQLHTEAYETFIADGGDKEAYTPAEDEIEQLFRATYGLYREKRQVFAEELEAVKLKNLELKNQILEEIRNLINSDENLKKTYDEFKVLQDKWKQIGVVPKTEVNTLWQSYHFLVEKFFDKVRINKELKDLDLKKNLEAKIELCEKAEELIAENSVVDSFKALQKLHEQWKEVGPVPQDKRDEVWDRFKLATDKINTRRREFYDQVHAELQSNLEARYALIAKAQELLAVPANNIKDWQEKTNTVNELFKLWKNVGPSPRKLNDELWNKFKTALDEFFKVKSEYFSTVKEQQVNNYNLKLELCLQAEALQNSTDWHNTSRELINLQNQWKKIGPVPRKFADKVWKRFRGACDTFFQAKSAYLSNVKGFEAENLAAKRELLQQIENFSAEADKQENLQALKDFQRKWMEIGHVPIKEKDKLQADFRKAIDKLMDRLNITNLDMNAANFKNRFEGLKDAPEGQRTIIKEVNFLQGKIQKMSEDMAVWENNIGFLANSKNANILKEEFEKKIEKARQEIKLLEAKVKFLRDELGK